MMPAFNAERYIAQAVESVLVQSYTPWELIVVNDGSTDGTAGVLERYSDSRIKVIHQTNSGEPAARNAALDAMQGEYVAFLDADDLYLEQHLKKALERLNECSCDGVYSDGHYCDQAGTPQRRLSSWRRGPFEGAIFPEVVRASDVFGPPVCVVLRRDPILKQGLRFDPRLPVGCDWDFLTRFSEHCAFAYVNDCTCLYRVHETNVTVLTSGRKRADSLALCRENAIRLPGFLCCSAEIQNHVFYDLLVNLLPGNPARQAETTGWPQFAGLPGAAQAKLLRLMASREIAMGRNAMYAREWLSRSRKLDRRDARGAVLWALFAVSPRLSRWILQCKNALSRRPARNSPFGPSV